LALQSSTIWKEIGQLLEKVTAAERRLQKSVPKQPSVAPSPVSEAAAKTWIVQSVRPAVGVQLGVEHARKIPADQ
jgi:hypothetical protein